MSFDLQPLLDRFDRLFPGVGPRYLVRAPGRLNIVGEHTDYNGLPVLPFAIDAGIRIVFAPVEDPTITLYAMDFPDTPPVTFRIERDIPASEQGHWVNYAKAAAQDGARAAAERGEDPERLRGFVGVIAGDLPKNAGLSSSSALVVATAVAFSHAQGWPVDPPALATRCADAEHYVGTRGGGMDQTTSLCGRKSACLKMYFHPLEVETVAVKVRCSFLVAHSRVEAAKSAGARHHYNQRVIECRLLTEMVGDALRRDGALPGGAEDAGIAEGRSSLAGPLRYLGDLRRVWPLDRLEALRDRALDAIPQEDYSWDDLARRLGGERLDALVRRGRFEELIPNLPPRLPLRRRAKYLFEEWVRVEKAARCLAAGDLDGLGAILFEAHRGLSKEYEVSHPRVDELVAFAKGFGLPGARMTGAGFGGSTIHLVPRGEEREYKDYLSRKFYTEPVEDVLGRFIHVFHPEDGARVEAL